MLLKKTSRLRRSRPWASAVRRAGSSRRTTKHEIVEAAAWARGQSVPLFVLGGGSNLLVADAGFSGLVLHVALRGIAVRESHAIRLRRIYRVAAGEDLGRLRRAEPSRITAQASSAWPGFPARWAERRCRMWALTGRRLRRSSSACAPSTAKSAFAEFSSRRVRLCLSPQPLQLDDRGRYIVTRVDLPPDAEAARRRCAMRTCSGPFRKLDACSLAEVAAAVRRIRQSKGMLLVEGDPDCRSAGSFFKNPMVPGDAGSEQIATQPRQRAAAFSRGPGPSPQAR